MDAVICCIALNEQLYIQEWINYHIKLGFAKIYVYDNSDDNNMLYIASHNIIVIHMPGTCKQLDAYSHFLNHYGMIHTWCAFIDCDEFIVLKQHKNIRDFCLQYLHSGALGINWVLFGSNNELKYVDKPVLERFTKRQSGINEHIKCIVCCADTIGFINPHVPILQMGTYIKDIRNNKIDWAFNYIGSDDICQINHYFVKSKEEFMTKIARGRADTTIHRSEEEFNTHDYNDIDDYTALNFNMS